MKKILVVFLVLAVAGGVFAQLGEWSIGGKAEIGVFIDLDNDADNEDEPAIYVGSGYNSPYGYYGPITGVLNLNYNMDSSGIGIRIDALDETFGGGYWYDGGNYKFEVDAQLSDLINGKTHVGRLWGYYRMVDELVHLEVAYNSRDTQFWVSDTTGAFGGAGGIGSPYIDVWSRIGAGVDTGKNPWDPYASPWGGDRETFTKVDHGNYLLADVQLSGISFGVMLRSIFINDFASGVDNTRNWLSGGNFTYNASLPKATGSNASKAYNFSEEVMKKITFGVKLDMQPVEIAAQFKLGDYGAYLGGKWSIGPVTVGASFMGILQETEINAAGEKERIDGASRIKVGGGVDYGADGLGVSIKGWYGLQNYGSEAGKLSQIGIEPGFYYNVIPTHLQFSTDFGFYFQGAKNADGEEVDLEKMAVIWAVQPQLFWNFMGSGAGSFWGVGTGMIVRYRLVKDAVSALDVSFKLNF